MRFHEWCAFEYRYESPPDIGKQNDDSRGYGCFLLLGGPGETRDTVERSIAFVDEIRPDTVTVKAGIRIYPGTPLEAIARSENMIGREQDLLQPAFYLAPVVREWVWEYLEKTVSERNNWTL